MKKHNIEETQTNKFNSHLTVKDTENLDNLRSQIDRLDSEIAQYDFTVDEEARKQFIQMIMELKEDSTNLFSFDTWRRIGNDLNNLRHYKENQIAHGVIEHMREGIEEDSERLV